MSYERELVGPIGGLVAGVGALGTSVRVFDGDAGFPVVSLLLAIGAIGIFVASGFEYRKIRAKYGSREGKNDGSGEPGTHPE